MKYKAFYTTYSTDDSVDPSDAISIDPAELPGRLKKHLLHNQDFFGVIDEHDETLQMMRGNADRVWLEIPESKKKGSFGRHLSIEEAGQLLADLAGPISEMVGSESIPDLQFVSWDSEKEKMPMAIPPEQIQSLAEDHGACFATDLVTRGDRGVNYLYREEPDFEEDSGWRFMAGSEAQDYLDEASNTGIYDVNVIANYQPDIVPLLDAEIGSAFERDADGEFVAAD